MPIIRMFGRLAIAVALIVLATAASKPAHADSSLSVDLTGQWLSHAGDGKDRQGNAVKETDWQTVSLPGTGAAAGFIWYRKHFTPPADWASNPEVTKFNRLYLHLGALHGAATIYVNGYEVNQIGKSPKPDGTGFQAIPTSADVIILIPISAPVQGGGVKTLINWGADNILSLRLYDTAAGSNPSSGPIEIDLPILTELYPTSVLTKQADHLFGGQNQVEFTATFTNTTSVAAPLDWSAGIFDDKGTELPGYTAKHTTGAIDPGTSDSYDSSFGFGTHPGFYTFRINTKIDGNALPAADFVAGWNADEILADETLPSDFDSYWSEVRSNAIGAGSVQVSADSADSSAGVAVYRVKYDGLGGEPGVAWLSVPEGLPANPVVVFHIPAYDADPTSPDIDMAKRGYIVFDFTVTATDWTSRNEGELYLAKGIESPKTFVFRDIEGNILRATAMLDNGHFPDIPAQHRLVVWGESQGGGLALITAGLLKQDISAVVAISPYFTDMTHTLDCATDQDNPFSTYIAAHPDGRQTVNTTLNYFDTIHFTPRITAPVFFSLGLKDRIVPPYSEFAAANGIAAQPGSLRTMDIEADGGHIPPAARSTALAWLSAILK